MKRGLHVKYRLFLSDINEIEFCRQFFENCSDVKFHEIASSRSWVLPCGRRTDRHTGITKV